MSFKLRILGIDPGVSATGYGIIDYVSEQPRLIDCGIIKPKAKGSSGEKFSQIYSGLSQLLKKHKPKVLAVEDSFLGKNFRSAKILGGAKAMVLLAGAQERLATHEYSPREIKQAVAGNGAASKQQVRFMVTRLLGLKSAPLAEDVSDALATALCCAFKNSSNGLKLK